MQTPSLAVLYNGNTYASKLLARWAFYFDRVGISHRRPTESPDSADASVVGADFWLPEGAYFVRVAASTEYRTFSRQEPWSFESKADSWEPLFTDRCSLAWLDPDQAGAAACGFAAGQLAARGVRVGVKTGLLLPQQLTDRITEHDSEPEFFAAVDGSPLGQALIESDSRGLPFAVVFGDPQERKTRYGAYWRGARIPFDRAAAEAARAAKFERA